MDTKTLITYSDLVDWGLVEDDVDPEIVAAFQAALPATPLEILRMEQFSAPDRLWVLLRPEIIPEADLHEFACKFAEAALPVWEAKFPGDRRPHEAIAAKRAWLRGEITDDELAAAREAAREAARNAARGAAWSAAWDAAWNAAWNAARCRMDAAWNAAWNAARCAAWDAAWGRRMDAARCAAWSAAWNAAWTRQLQLVEQELLATEVDAQDVLAAQYPVCDACLGQGCDECDLMGVTERRCNSEPGYIDDDPRLPIEENND